MLRRMLLALVLLLVPTHCIALQLHWASGESTISFTTTKRCTLIVEADPDESSLPSQWSLLWTANHCGDLTPMVDSESADTSAAHLSEFGAPSLAELAAHVHGATFLSTTTQFVTRARYILELPAGSSGILQAIASEAGNTPTERRVFRSQIARFNGGVAHPLPPTIVYARTDQGPTRLQLEIQGVGLRNSIAVALVAPDTSSRVRLQIDALSDTTISAHADGSSNSLEAVVEVIANNGTGSAAQLAAAPCSGYAEGLNFSKFNFAMYMDPNPYAVTKDFALFFNHNQKQDPRTPLFHLMYIRHNEVPAPAETTLAHAWSVDMVHWRVDTTAFLNGEKVFSSDTKRWDRNFVWAPSLIASGDSTFMFYTGEDAGRDQTIGYASTLDLDTCNTVWTRHTTPTWTTEKTAWALRRKHIVGLGRQFRDPYLLKHPAPDSAGFYYMVFAASDSADVSPTTAPQAVGLARNEVKGKLNKWVDYGYFPSTAIGSTGFGQLEGPILFPDSGTPTGWITMFSNSGGGALSARFERQTPGLLPSATSPASWTTPPNVLFNYLGSSPTDSTVAGWQGTEYLRVSDNAQYLAGFTAEGTSHVFSGVPGVPNGPHLIQGIAISRLNWTGRNFTLGTANTTSVDAVDSPASAVRMAFIEYRPRSRRISWRISMPTAMPTRLDVYDVMGRSRRRVIDRVIPAGISIITWDTSDDSGELLRSGMYYARLTFEGGVRLSGVPIIR
jgi:hypothetical protein